MKSIITADMNYDGFPDLIYVENYVSFFNIKVILLYGCLNNCTFTMLADDALVLIGVDAV